MSYRAKLELEEVEPYTDGNGYRREHTTTITHIVVTGATESDVVDQMRNHVSELQNWYAAAPSTPEATA